MTEEITRVQIPVAILEFDAGSHTIWIQSADGATTMRIKCSGKINIDRCKTSPFSHCDIYLKGDIDFCISEDANL
jgi:hypothetical protein